MQSGRTTTRQSSKDILNKKVPSNPKYKNVRSKLDTGASMSKYMEKVEEMRRSPSDMNMSLSGVAKQVDTAASQLRTYVKEILCGNGMNDYRYRKDEIFKRMKISTFVTLVIQVYHMRQDDSLDDLDDLDSARSPSQGGDADDSSPVPPTPLTDRDNNNDGTEINTARSTLQSVIGGVGECNVNDAEEIPRTPPIDPSTEVPYLLLDLRDSDDFETCHIISAKNYPVAMLSRAVNNYTNDIMQYKNKPGKLIIIYDEDERIAIKAATTFVQRGFDNTFMLSGGLKVAAQKYPHSLIAGTLPPSCAPSPPPSKGKKKSPPTPQQIIPASQGDFTEDDIYRLQDQLDEALVPSDTGSRLSRASSRPQSNASVASSRASTSLSTASSQPWR